MKFRITAMYHFVHLPEFEALRQPLLDVCKKNDLKGTLLLAQEGLNGTIAGTEAAVENLLHYLMTKPEFTELSHKSSYAHTAPFLRMKVKLKNEIVTLGVEGVSPQRKVGTYVKPSDWNELIQDPEVILIDTRNTYETEIGTFQHALDPRTTSFREFPQFVAEHLDKNIHKKVAMFCTGGIRCEKASSYLLDEGFEQVFHLQGGILQYLEDVPEHESLWQGECFVFDERVTVKHDLSPGEYTMCHACRQPLSVNDIEHETYQAGISCRHCAGEKSAAQLQRYSERQKQMQLAQQRDQQHLGAVIKS